MKFYIINGPNINMVGIREKQIYGTMDFNQMIELIQSESIQRGIEVECFQSNHEGTLVDIIQDAYFKNIDGIVINPAAYTHTSVAIADAIKAIAPIPVVEVHLSDIKEREAFRHHSYCAPYCIEQIKGHGPQGYIMAMDVLIKAIGEKQ